MQFAVGIALLSLSGVVLAVDREDVTYYLFNDKYYNEEINSEELEAVDTSQPALFLIHGWVGDSNDSWVEDLTDVLLEKGSVNVVTVDWSGPAGDFYPTTVDEVKYIGQYVGEFLATLYEKYGEDPSSIQLIGHSLGAQVAGLAGKTFRELSGATVGKIVGLDAALPLFLTAGEDERLSPDDADLVVAIHTDGGAAGFLTPIADVDFYPNGGTPPQPGCIEITTDCSHQRAPEYYVEAVTNPSGFVAKKCDSYIAYELGLCDDNEAVTIGGDLSTDDAGVYYLDTNSEPPYSKE